MGTIVCVFPSPLVGEGDPSASEDRVRGMNLTSDREPLTRVSFASQNFATLSHKGRGEDGRIALQRNGVVLAPKIGKNDA